MTMLKDFDRAALPAGLDAAGADGWLLFDFHGMNPVAARGLGLGGMGTRRLFVYIPREGPPTAVAHKIELAPLEGFPGTILPYARWQELHEALGSVVRGKTVAMEISPGKENETHICNVYISLGKLLNAGKWKCLDIVIKTHGTTDLEAYQKAIETTNRLYKLEVVTIDSIEENSLTAINNLSNISEGVEVTTNLTVEDSKRLHE